MLLNVIFDEIVLFLGPLPLLQAPFHWAEFFLVSNKGSRIQMRGMRT
jgi:hypothetical protein